MKTYAVNEIFYSLQGEGARAGSANVFVRFAGCNLTCKVETHGFDCDTEFRSSRQLTAEEIRAEVGRIGGECKNVIFTGGEPLLQLDNELLNCFDFFFICVETNGTLEARDLRLNYIACSPKVAEHAIRLKQADEVRYVRHYGQGIPKPALKNARLFLSPAWAPGEGFGKNLEWCMKLVKENPDWSLSMQQHKVWGVR